MCETAKQLIKKYGEAIHIKTEDGYCPTQLYYHIHSCTECVINSDNVEQLGSR